MKQVASLLIFLFPVFLPWSCAWADCLYQCEGSLCADFGNTTDLCLKTRAECEHSCRNKRSYGAIAYSTANEGYGWSDHWDFQDQAEKVAIKNCSEHGPDCEVVVWYYDSCGAVAADGKVVSWGRESTKPKAEQSALADCAKAGGKNCEIKTSQCSFK